MIKTVYLYIRKRRTKCDYASLYSVHCMYTKQKKLWRPQNILQPRLISTVQVVQWAPGWNLRRITLGFPGIVNYCKVTSYQLLPDIRVPPPECNLLLGSSWLISPTAYLDGLMIMTGNEPEKLFQQHYKPIQTLLVGLPLFQFQMLWNKFPSTPFIKQPHHFTWTGIWRPRFFIRVKAPFVWRFFPRPGLGVIQSSGPWQVFPFCAAGEVGG